MSTLLCPDTGHKFVHPHTIHAQTHILYRYDFEAFKLCHMLSTYVLHNLMQNYVRALELWVPVEPIVIAIEFKLRAQM